LNVSVAVRQGLRLRRVRGLSAQLDDVLLTGLAACAIQVFVPGTSNP